MFDVYIKYKVGGEVNSGEVYYYTEQAAGAGRMGGTAGRGVGKVEPGSEKILGVGLNFKIDICPAHPRSDVGLEKLRALCIKRDHKKIHIWLSKPRLSICAASTEHKETSTNDESINAQN